MLTRKPRAVSSPAWWRGLLVCFLAAILASGVFKEQPANRDARWVPSSPEKIVWLSEGSAKVLGDHSIELQGSSGWQELTLYFQPAELTRISRVRLEVLPSARSHANEDQRLVLFEVKPHLESAEKSTTQLEFKSCRFLGNVADDTAANCIDFLSDAGWTVPDFAGKDACHQLVLELHEPISVQRNNMFAITIDSGGAPDLTTLSRVRVSFSGTDVVANQEPNAAISAGTQDRTKLNGVSFAFRRCPPGQFLMGSLPGRESKYGEGVWTDHWFTKTEYNYGFNEWYFTNRRDYDAFLENVPSFNWGENYPNS